MKFCECGGDYLRHGIVKTGIRYICRDCRKSFTQRGEDVIKGKKTFNETGRPTLNDWRFK